jgi:hypothetical protein
MKRKAKKVAENRRPIKVVNQAIYKVVSIEDGTFRSIATAICKDAIALSEVRWRGIMEAIVQKKIGDIEVPLLAKLHAIAETLDGRMREFSVAPPPPPKPWWVFWPRP